MRNELNETVDLLFDFTVVGAIASHGDVEGTSLHMRSRGRKAPGLVRTHPLLVDLHLRDTLHFKYG